MELVELKGIRKKYEGKEILKGIDLKIRKGEMVSLLGPSGCGKTTTLRILAGILEVDEGAIVIDGKDVTFSTPKDRGAVLVFQDYLLFPHLTVRKNIAFGLKAQKYPRDIIDQTVNQLIDLVELNGQEQKFPFQLSGGQKQRVALARALAVNPQILLLDEPFSNLDNRLRETMQQLIKKIHKEMGTTMVLVTHSKEEAFRMSERIVLMFDGTVAQSGTSHELYQKPNSIQNAKFMGEVYSLKVTVIHRKGKTILGDYDTELADGNYCLYYRRNSFYECKDGIKVTVSQVEYSGETSVCYVNGLNYFKGAICKNGVRQKTNVGDELFIKVNFEEYIYKETLE